MGRKGFQTSQTGAELYMPLSQRPGNQLVSTSSEAHVFSVLGTLGSFPFIHRLLGGPRALKTCPRVPSAPGEGHERQPPFQVTGWKPTRRLRVLTPGQGKRRGGQGPGHLLHAGREEFFAGFLKELLLRLGDQVPSNLGDENWGLKAGREKEASVGQRAGGRAATGLHPPAPGPGCLPSWWWVVRGGGGDGKCDPTGLDFRSDFWFCC